MVVPSDHSGWGEEQNCQLITTWWWVWSDGRGGCWTDLVNPNMYWRWTRNVWQRPLYLENVIVLPGWKGSWEHGIWVGHPKSLDSWQIYIISQYNVYLGKNTCNPHKSCWHTKKQQTEFNPNFKLNAWGAVTGVITTPSHISIWHMWHIWHQCVCPIAATTWDDAEFVFQLKK